MAHFQPSADVLPFAKSSLENTNIMPIAIQRVLGKPVGCQWQFKNMYCQLQTLLKSANGIVSDAYGNALTCYGSDGAD